MTLPNKVTIARLCLIPLFARSVTSPVSPKTQKDRRWLPSAIFFLAASTDALDGFLARRLKQQSKLGAMLDPVADKGLVITAITLLSSNRVYRLLPVWFGSIVISRDVLLMVGYLVLLKVKGKARIRPSWAGKAATVFQLASICCGLAGSKKSVVQLFTVIATLLTVSSGIGYYIDGLRQIGGTRSVKQPFAGFARLRLHRS
ncbi:MAG: CDP-alcohol phosphatidyltransferase family protein [Verrucomicrobia bacterium]|nr:CDP-alcohol phosphatidyltransferase family protein [Verrucomicrobiota bacterium]